GAALEEGLRTGAKRAGVPIRINRKCGALTLYFTDQDVTDYEGAEKADGAQFARFFRSMLRQGIYLAPSKYEAWFLTTAHSDDDVAKTIAAAEIAFTECQ
ncbi:aspartate aminotransferase family protein, partial [Klebsiella pneumoniae]